ncbi:hypothetical protein Tco_0594277 [Tanacetum coccineum]
MNDPNITMEEYIRLEEEKAQSRGETFNWQTATFGRIRHYYEEERFTNFKEELPAIVFGKIKGNSFNSEQGGIMGEFDDEREDFEIEFPAIVFNNTSDTTPLCEPTPIRFQLLTKIPQKYECVGDVVDFRTWPGISLKTSMMSTMDLDGVTCLTVIMESLVKKKQKGAILELKRRHLKNTIFCTYTPYPAMKIRRISASSAQETRNDQFPIRRIHYNQYAVCTAVHQSKIHI